LQQARRLDGRLAKVAIRARHAVDEPWVLPPLGSVVASLALEAFRASGLKFPRRIVVTESALARFNLPATGSFLTIFPASVLKFPTNRNEIKALPVQLPTAPVPTGILTLKSRTLSSVARAFYQARP